MRIDIILLTVSLLCIAVVALTVLSCQWYEAKAKAVTIEGNTIGISRAAALPHARPESAITRCQQIAILERPVAPRLIRPDVFLLLFAHCPDA